MKGRVRKNQWIDNVLFNGAGLLMVEQNDGDWMVRKSDPNEPRQLKDAATTIFVCEDGRLKVGQFLDGAWAGRCVLEHDPKMYWNSYSPFFPQGMTRVATCYIKKTASMDEAVTDLVEYILLKQIEGNILLIGYGFSGLMMYKVGVTLPKDHKRNVSVITVASPFKDAISANNDIFGNKLKPMPAGRNHIAFITPEDFSHKRGFFKNSNRNSDKAIPFEKQKEWPYVGNEVRLPDMCLVVHEAKNKVFEKVLTDFGIYAGGESFFSELEEFSESEEVYKMIDDTT